MKHYIYSMESVQTLILNPNQCKQKIDRIAHQIHESFYESEILYIVGIANRGYLFAEQIARVLEKICAFKIQLVQLKLNKDNPITNPVELEVPIEQLNGASVVLVDDVLNSGKTLIYALTHLLKADLKMIKTATLVDRRHRRYPVRADYVGLTLSTTLQEHISVEFKGSEIEVFLK